MVSKYFLCLLALSISLSLNFSCKKDPEIKVDEKKIIKEFLDKYTFYFGTIRKIGDTLNGNVIKGKPFKNLFTKDKSGFYYWIQNKGNGISPDSNDSILINYRVRSTKNSILDNGTLNTTGIPRWLALSNSIKGWQQALPLFKSRNKKITDVYVNQGVLLIPSSLAYGNLKSGNISANTPLVFEIELYQVKKVN